MAKFIQVIGKVQTQRFLVIANAPHIEELNTFGIPVVSWKMLVTTKVENCDDVKFEWFVLEKNGSNQRRVVSRSNFFVPAISKLDLWIKVTPRRNNISGIAVEKHLGTILDAPKGEELEPVLLRTKEMDLRRRDNIAFRVATYNVMHDSKLKKLNSYRIPFIYNEELKRINADVFMLQEVDRKVFDWYLQPHLKHIGFNGIFVRNAASSAGLACFFNLKRFELLKSKHVCLGDTFRKGGCSHDLASQYLKIADTDDNEIFRPVRFSLSFFLVSHSHKQIYTVHDTSHRSQRSKA